MTIKITFEFPSVDEAIVALAKLSPAAKGGATPQAAPAVGGSTRKGRADRGQKREPYGPRAQEAATGAGEPTQSAVPAAGVQDAPVAASTEPAAPAVAPAVTPPHTSPETPSTSPAVAAATQAEAQSALEKLFEAKGMEPALGAMSRYGVKRLRDMKPEHYGEFKALAEGIVAGTTPI